ncbi:MAG: lipoate--protein ligase family protein, partial [Muribaculum sp.]|nr:lipoate--protein ligase family protein [Muribaculum sp.]
MKYVTLPDSEPHRLPFYLAMEEYIAINTREEALFMWQVDPTVIFGRNQAIEKEVDLDYCRSKEIQFYRRKSGGGCVYADLSNIMFSFITTATDIPSTFAHYTGQLADMLKSLGLNASSSGRNDVTINGRKVSGNAFYQIGDRSIVHGTMLYDTDIENMTKAISPSESKLMSKGVD